LTEKLAVALRVLTSWVSSLLLMDASPQSWPRPATATNCAKPLRLRTGSSVYAAQSMRQTAFAYSRSVAR